MSLKPTAAVVFGTHGSAETISGLKELLEVHADGLDESKNSLVVSKFEDK